jgi:hypothetical protein
VKAIRKSVAEDAAADRVQKELLRALESVRTRFAVAIAVETKTTSRSQWLHYLETADQTMRVIRRLRKMDTAGAPSYQGWLYALELLRQLPPQANAPWLCQILRTIASQLDSRQ